MNQYTLNLLSTSSINIWSSLQHNLKQRQSLSSGVQFYELLVHIEIIVISKSRKYSSIKMFPMSLESNPLPVFPTVTANILKTGAANFT